MLINVLKEKKVEQVAFFSVSKNLNAEGIERLHAYSDAGHIIANHTHSHPDINKLDLEEYKQDFLKANSLLSQFKNFKKLFRFPYLREGDTKEKQVGMRTLLKKHKYTNAYITLNNYDWYIESLFQKALKQGRQIDLEKLQIFYVDVLIESIEYYDEMAKTHLGRSPKHILLLHEMDISALFLGALIDKLRSKGWNIITPEDAYKDKISQHKIHNTLRFNPGRIGYQ